LRTAYTGTGLSVAITGRVKGVTYYYRVKATKTGFTSSAPHVAANGCHVPFLAGVPASITVPVSDADGVYTVTWTASATTGVTYVLEEATNNTFSIGLRTAYTGTGLSAAITGRVKGVTYYYRVKATKTGFTSSAPRVAANGCRVPFLAGVPASITVPVSDADGVYTVTWTASATTGVTYVLEEATNNTFSTGLRTAYTGTGLSAAITGRVKGLTYYYRVKATKTGFTSIAPRVAVNGCRVG
jgi:acylphosphatase